MLYWLTLFSDGGDFFNLFRYITFRAGGAFFTALDLRVPVWTPAYQSVARAGRSTVSRSATTVRKATSKTKAGTPTMGGVLILGAVVTSSLLWARLDIGYVWMVLFVTIAFGADRLCR